MKKEHPKPEKMIVKSSQRRPVIEPDVESDLPLTVKGGLSKIASPDIHLSFTGQ